PARGDRRHRIDLGFREEARHVLPARLAPRRHHEPLLPRAGRRLGRGGLGRRRRAGHGVRAPRARALRLDDPPRGPRPRSGARALLRAAALAGRYTRRYITAMRRPAALALCLALAPPAGADTVTVFAAASLKESLDAVTHAFEIVARDKVTVSYAASNALARQIE